MSKVLTVNNLIRYINNSSDATEIVRIVYLNGSNDVAFVMDICANKGFPEFCRPSLVMGDVELGKAEILLNDPWATSVKDTDLSDIDKELRDRAWNIICDLVDPSREPAIFDKKERNKLFADVMKKHNVLPRSLHKYMRRFWQRGKVKNALLPDYKNSGAGGKERSAGEAKRGRKRRSHYDPEITEGINVDENMKKIFRIAVSRFGHLITCRKDSIENPIEVKKIIETHNHDVKIALNPAGFVSLRSVFTHFEFYSVLFNISEVPLFFAGLQKSNDKKYLFETIIENVFAKVEIHCKYMKIFYRKTFEEKLKMSSEAYSTSKFAFKHFLFSKASMNQKGLFHATRLATYHISYIDNFRRWIIENSNESTSVINDVNTKLISQIQKYRILLDEWEGLQEYKSEIDINLTKAIDNIHISISPQNIKVKNE